LRRNGAERSDVWESALECTFNKERCVFEFEKIADIFWFEEPDESNVNVVELLVGSEFASVEDTEEMSGESGKILDVVLLGVAWTCDIAGETGCEVDVVIEFELELKIALQRLTEPVTGVEDDEGASAGEGNFNDFTVVEAACGFNIAL
jgi:hypothetical protein